MLGFSAVSEVPLSSLPSSVARTASGFLATHIGTPKAQLTQPATGFQSTALGTPLAPYFTTGFKSTQFGTPYAKFSQFGTATGFKSTVLSAHSTPLPATGFCSTHIGTPYGVFWQICEATGFNPTQFGTPFGHQFWSVVWALPSTRFGTPTTPTNRTCIATSLHSTAIGWPSSNTHLPPEGGRTGMAYGFRLTQIGSPRATWPQTAIASGSLFGALGHPVADLGQSAAGFNLTQMGTPQIQLVQRATGFKPVRFGLGVALLTQHATGAQFVQRFGLPESDRSNTYKVYGINVSGRIGSPTGFSRFNYRVTGFRPVAIGSATCHESHRASHVAPICRLGAPILKRNTQC